MSTAQKILMVIGLIAGWSSPTIIFAITGMRGETPWQFVLIPTGVFIAAFIVAFIIATIWVVLNRNHRI